MIDRREAIEYIQEWLKDKYALNGKDRVVLNMAKEALEREEEYGQMVVDYTKGEALKSGDWEYTNTPIDTPTNIPTDTPTNDCISRQQAIDAIEGVDWYHVNPKGELVSGSTSDEESWYKAEDVYKAIESLPPVEPKPVCEDAVSKG